MSTSPTALSVKCCHRFGGKYSAIMVPMARQHLSPRILSVRWPAGSSLSADQRITGCGRPDGFGRVGAQRAARVLAQSAA